MIRWDLQQFADKTERATPKHRQEAKDKGSVAHSSDFTSAVGFLAFVIGLKLFGGSLLAILIQDMQTLLSEGTLVATAPTGVTTYWLHFLWPTATAVLPILFLGLGFGLFTAFIQVGPMFSPTVLLPDFTRIDPLKGLGRLFSMRSWAELLKSVLKLSLIAVVVYQAIASAGLQFPEMINTDPKIVAGYFAQTALAILLNVAIIFVILSVADYVFQRFQFEKGIRMSKEDIRDESKRSDGNPVIKRRIRERGRAIARQRMMKKVPTADVVITNPTHFAVALKYEPGQMHAPQVVAKGIDQIALRIRELAKQHRVPIVENRTVARALYYAVELDEFVPANLFQAVAEILAYVYRMQQRVR